MHWYNPAVEYQSLDRDFLADKFNDSRSTEGDVPLSTKSDSDFAHLSGKVCSPLIHINLSALPFSSGWGFEVGVGVSGFGFSGSEEGSYLRLIDFCITQL